MKNKVAIFLKEMVGGLLFVAGFFGIPVILGSENALPFWCTSLILVGLAAVAFIGMVLLDNEKENKHE